MKNFIGLLLLVVLHVNLIGQKPLERSVRLWTEIDESANTITLNWVANPEATAYLVYERNSNDRWELVATNDPAKTNHVFENRESNTLYEFKVLKNGGLTGNGYATVAYKLEAKHDRGRCLIVIDQSIEPALRSKINRWKEDVCADGWQVDEAIVSRMSTPPEVKTHIQNWYDEEAKGSHSVLLFGHVPVPYSGLMNPDGHGNHIGAWVADTYYGDIDGNWTDATVNNTSAAGTRNDNVPGDGKFDNTTIPSMLEVEVGRVDFSNLPAFTESEVELLEKYLDKNHDFRRKNFDVPRRGLIEDNFRSFDEGFSQNGWKNMSIMFGPDSVKWGDYETDLVDQGHLFSYACGGGSFTSCGGIGSTSNLWAAKELETVFTMVFGSYFGDWDSSNNFLRSALASGKILTNAWAGRPNWHFHHMALGQHIGYSGIQTQNNLNVLYDVGLAFFRYTHVTLLGDPTLRMHTVYPISDLVLTPIDLGMQLSWMASADADDGYFIYRKSGSEYDLLTSSPITETVYYDECIPKGKYEYMVKAVKLEETASGSYYNTSLGLKATESFDKEVLAEPGFTFVDTYEKVNFTNTSLRGNSYEWDFGDSAISTEEHPEHVFSTAGTYTVCLTANGDCGSETICQDITVSSSLPSDVQFEIKNASCYDGNDGSVTPIFSGGVGPFSFNWSNGSMDSINTDLSANDYELILTSAIGARVRYNMISVSQPDSLTINVMTTPSNGNNGTAVANVTGGTPPYNYTWGDGTIDPNMLPPGDYTLTVVDANGCEKKVRFTVKMVSSTQSELSQRLMISPNPSEGIFTLEMDENISIANLSLINSLGQKLNLNIDNTGIIDLSKCSNGIYKLIIKTNLGEASKIIVKQ